MPPNEFDAFYDRVTRNGGIDRPAWEGVQDQRPPRPMPRQMRSPAQRANDPRLAQSERDRALRQFDRSNAANVDTYQRQAFDQRNQAAEAASMAAESTGLPAIRRAGSDLTRWGAYTAGTEQGNDDLASGALNLGAGSLGVLGMAGMVPRAPMRGALRPPVTAPEVAPPRITRPPTEIAPNGMPIAPPRPFRNSLRGGSSDLMDAAGMMAPPRTARPPAQAPDAGGGRGGQDLSDFDTDQVWTRAVKGGVDPFEVQPAPGNTMGPGLYFGSDDIVGRAARRIGDDAAVHGAYIRNGKTASYQQWRQAYERAEKGPFGARSAAETERRAVADLERQGYIGVYRRHNHDGSAEINVFRRENVVGVPQESPAPAAPDVGNAGPEIDALEGPFFHGTSDHGFEVPSPRNQSGGTPAIYLAENERFARQFADIEGEGTGRVLQFSLRRDDIARMDNPEHFERVAQALSQRLGWEMDVARQQLRQRVQDGRLDWAYRQGNQAVRDAGFPAVALNDAYGERSIAVYNKDSLLRPNENADMVRPQK